MEVLRRTCAPALLGAAWQQALSGESEPGRPCTSCKNPTTLVQVGEDPTARGALCTSCHLAWFDAAAWGALPRRDAEPSRERSPLPRGTVSSAEPPGPRRTPGALDPSDDAIHEEPGVAVGSPLVVPDPSLDEPAPGLSTRSPALRSIDPARVVGHSAPVGDTSTYSLVGIPGVPGAERGLVTWGVIASLALVGATTLPLPSAPELFGFRPSHPTAGLGLPLISSFYIHAGLGHLLVSLYFLAALGDRVESMLGTRRYLSTLVAGTIFGSVAYSLGGPMSQTPLVGAGAGITALIVLYALAVPRARVSFLIFVDQPRLSVWSFLGIWTLVQLVGDFAVWGSGAETPYSLHLAGGLVGFVAWLGVLFEAPPPPVSPPKE